MLEAEHLAALWIHAGHHMPDGAVFPGGIHRLKNQQHCITIGCVVKLLLRTQFLNMFSEKFLILFFRPIYRFHPRWPLFELDLFSRRDTEIFGIDFHLRAYFSRFCMCDGHAWRAVLGASRAVWLFQTSG